MAKVFISFLGNNNYITCNYYFNNDKSDVVKGVRFIQEALVQKYFSKCDKTDRVIIFLTPEAEQKNWIDATDELGNKFHGLEVHLKRLGLPLSIKPVKNIPKGSDESEIWDLFSMITKHVNEKDEIYLDITYGFRSLPMLGMVLLNYLKVTKNIHVAGIFYGAFERLGYQSDVIKMDLEERNVPVLELSSFQILQSWALGADNFINYGITGKIEQAISDEINRIERKSGAPQKDPKSIALSKFQKQLKGLAPGFQTVRGKEILEAKKIIPLKETIDEIKGDEHIAPFKIILDKISHKLSPFKRNNVENGFAGVKWCIDHGMIQQGITMLQENTITWVLITLANAQDQHNDQDQCLDYTNRCHREIVSDAFIIVALPPKKGKKKWNTSSKENPELAIKIQKFISEDIKGLIGPFNSLRTFRNDINHGGFTVKRKKGASDEKPRNSGDFVKKLDDTYTKIKGIIDAFESSNVRSGHDQN